MREPGERRNFRFAWRVAVLLVNGLGVIFLALLLLLAAAAYIVLPRLAGSSRIKTVMVQQLEDALHRPVSIGQVVLAPQGIKISAVEIANKTPGEGDLLDGESAIVTIKILPLLRRRLEIKTVRIFRPVIRLVREKDGRWSFSDIIHSTEPARSPAAPFFSMPVSLYAGKTVIQNGAVIIDDRYRGRVITVSGLDMTIRSPDARLPFPFSASFANSFQFKRSKVTALCALSGTVSLDGLNLSSATATANEASVSVGGAIFSGRLALRDFLHPTIQGHFLAPALSQSWLSAQTGRSAAFPWPQSRWSFVLEFPSARRMIVSDLDMAAQAFSAHASGTVDFSSAPFSLQARVQVSSAPLQNFSFLAPGLARDDVRGKLAADAELSGPWTSLRADRADVRLEDFSAHVKPFTIAAGLLTASASGNFSKFSLSADQGSLRALGHSLTDASLQANLARGRLAIRRLSCDWEGTRVIASGDIANVARPERIYLRAWFGPLRWSHARQLTVDVAAYLSQLRRERSRAAPPSPERHWVAFFKYHIPKRFPATSGRITVSEVKDKDFWFKNASLVWSLRGVTPRLNTASGEVRLGLGPGHFDNLQSILESSKFMKVAFLPYVYMHKMNSFSVLSTAAAYPDTFDFNRIGGQYSVHDGLVRTRFFHVDSPQLAAFAQGEADFAKETVNMEVLTRLSHYDAPLPEWWVDELGRPAIGFWVKGSLDHPTIEPRLQKMGAHEIEQALAKAEARARERLREGDR
ncbi:MAG: AsmA family protein [Elusimicrobia bacterium]|nr:AsmA family protein [Elusimicrobiota bacterium]